MQEREWLACDSARPMIWHLLYQLTDGNYLGINTFIRSKLVSERKLQLFIVAVCRLTWSHLSTPARQSLELAERNIDEQVSAQDLAEALININKEVVWSARNPTGVAPRLLGVVEGLLQGNTAAATLATEQWLGLLDDCGRADLVRDIFGNPFRPITLCGMTPKPFHNQYVHVDKNDGFWLAMECPVCDRLRTPDVLALAQVAYNEHSTRCPGTAAGPCCQTHLCPVCQGTGHTGDGRLDLDRLKVLSDALEESGCADELCKKCHGVGTYSVQVTNPGLSDANGYSSLTTYSEWRGCPHCGGDYKTKGSGRVLHPLLAHLRSPGPHVRGCWALDLILNKQ